RLVARVDEKVRAVGRDRRALNLVGCAREVVEPLRQVARLRAHLAEQLPRVARLECGQRVGVALEDPRQRTEEARAGAAGRRPPRATERLGRGADGSIDVVGAAVRNDGPRLPGVWV